DDDGVEIVDVIDVDTVSRVSRVSRVSVVSSAAHAYRRSARCRRRRKTAVGTWTSANVLKHQRGLIAIITSVATQAIGCMRIAIEKRRTTGPSGLVTSPCRLA